MHQHFLSSENGDCLPRKGLPTPRACRMSGSWLGSRELLTGSSSSTHHQTRGWRHSSGPLAPTNITEDYFSERQVDTQLLADHFSVHLTRDNTSTVLKWLPVWLLMWWTCSMWCFIKYLCHFELVWLLHSLELAIVVFRYAIIVL